MDPLACCTEQDFSICGSIARGKIDFPYIEVVTGVLAGYDQAYAKIVGVIGCAQWYVDCDGLIAFFDRPAEWYQ